ncbi:MAG TPA: sugar ABC transporter permease [Burkholderiaceae bacterium]
MPARLHALQGWLLLAPSLVLLAAFTHYPALATLWNSFRSTPKANRPAVFTGLDQYRFMAEDPIFWSALANSFVYAIGTIVPAIALAIVMALWVNRRIAGRGLLRLAFFTPTMLPMIAVANIWVFFYTPDYGLLAQALGAIGLSPSHNWLGSPNTALASVMAVAVWKEAGFFMIFYLAALQQMPPELTEAARLEGASRWQCFWKVTFPLLMPTTLFVLVTAVINAFRLVDHIFVMTGSGPDNATMLLFFYIYENGFKFWDSGYASALTMVLLAILALIAAVQFLVVERRTHYQ